MTQRVASVRHIWESFNEGPQKGVACVSRELPSEYFELSSFVDSTY